jgi:hypothetical protein
MLSRVTYVILSCHDTIKSHAYSMKVTFLGRKYPVGVGQSGAQRIRVITHLLSARLQAVTLKQRLLVGRAKGLCKRNYKNVQ